MSVNRSFNSKKRIHTCLKNQEDPGVSEVAFIGVILHVAKAAEDLQRFTDASPRALRAEHLPEQHFNYTEYTARYCTCVTVLMYSVLLVQQSRLKLA